MAMKSKNIPNAVHDVLQKFYGRESPLFKRIKSEGEFLLKYVDIDSESNFFFEITSFSVDSNNAISFWLSRAPQSHHNVAQGKILISSRVIDQYFSNWVEELETYSKRQGLFEENSLLKQYEKEFYSEIVVDPNANTTSFDYKKQFELDRYLDRVITLLEEAKNESNATDIDEVKNDVIELKNNQTKFTKKVVVEHICKIWAKVRKIGIPLLIMVKDEALKELVKVGVKFLTSG